MSLLLAFVMILGIVPSGMITSSKAADTSGAPQKVSFAGEKMGVHYWSPNWTTKQTYLELFTMKDGTGQEYTGFCDDRTKGPPQASATYTLSWVKSADEIPEVAWALDWYFWCEKQGIEEWRQYVYTVVAQSALWFYMEGRLDWIEEPSPTGT